MNDNVYHVCIVGCGPAGLYTAKHLLNLGIKITAFESENDILHHPKCTFYNKINVSEFKKITQNKNFTVNFNRKIDLQAIKGMGDEFDAFVIATGSTHPKHLKTNFKNIYSAYSIINSLKGCENRKYNFGSNILLIGAGNVALDFIKFLLQQNISFNSVNILCRKKLGECAFTNESLRELFTFKNVQISHNLKYLKIKVVLTEWRDNLYSKILRFPYNKLISVHSIPDFIFIPVKRFLNLNISFLREMNNLLSDKFQLFKILKFLEIFEFFTLRIHKNLRNGLLKIYHSNIQYFSNTLEDKEIISKNHFDDCLIPSDSLKDEKCKFIKNNLPSFLAKNIQNTFHHFWNVKSSLKELLVKIGPSIQSIYNNVIGKQLIMKKLSKILLFNNTDSLFTLNFLNPTRKKYFFDTRIEKRRAKMFMAETKGDRNINFVFDSYIEKIFEKNNKPEVTYRIQNNSAKQVFDSVIYAIGFKKDDQFYNLKIKKPTYFVGWAKEPHGNLNYIENEAFLLSQKLYEKLSRKICE